MQWLYEAKNRFGLVILNYFATTNHIHLIVKGTNGTETIPKSIQLLAGRTGQEYHQRKKRKGAFGEDRYHAMAIETAEHLFDENSVAQIGGVSNFSHTIFPIDPGRDCLSENYNNRVNQTAKTAATCQLSL